MGWASCFEVRIVSFGVPGSSGSCLMLFGRSGFSRFPSSTLLPLVFLLFWGLLVQTRRVGTRVPVCLGATGEPTSFALWSVGDWSCGLYGRV